MNSTNIQDDNSEKEQYEKVSSGNEDSENVSLRRWHIWKGNLWKREIWKKTTARRKIGKWIILERKQTKNDKTEKDTPHLIHDKSEKG